MIHTVTSAPGIADALPTRHEAPQPPKPAAPQQDSVHLSKAALASLNGGDPDHDGD